jgi:hypothetical protein
MKYAPTVSALVARPTSRITRRMISGGGPACDNVSATLSSVCVSRNRPSTST